MDIFIGPYGTKSYFGTCNNAVLQLADKGDAYRSRITKGIRKVNEYGKI